MQDGRLGRVGQPEPWPTTQFAGWLKYRQGAGNEVRPAHIAVEPSPRKSQDIGRRRELGGYTGGGSQRRPCQGRHEGCCHTLTGDIPDGNLERRQ